MIENLLIPLFRESDVRAIADRLPSQGWMVLYADAFEKAWDDLAHGRLKGEANTREKIIEPILYEALGYDRGENDAEHAVSHAGAGGERGAIEYFFSVSGNHVPIEAKAWEKPLDKKGGGQRSPVRQGFDYAVLSNLRWFIVTNGAEWRLYKTQLKGSQSPLEAAERYYLKDLLASRREFLKFVATFGRQAFVPNREGWCRLDQLRQQNEGWQEAISETIYAKLVDARVQLFRAIQPRFPGLPQEEINEAVVKLLFRILFIRFAENTPLLPEEFLSREIIEQFERARKWGDPRGLYGYVQRYFAWLDGRDANEFGIFPYDGTLFDPDPVLDSPDFVIDDELLKRVLDRLSREQMGRSINYAQINPRILGNIYERFLGYVIEINEGRLNPQAERDTRRREGSFYTPELATKFLVEHCVERALEANPDRNPWELTCLDPACGSGHFLVEYVNHVAGLSEEMDDSRSYSQWKRYITEHCVYGVDKDRTAVMLTKLSLWINSAMKDEPFATIDTHVKCANSLVCGTPAGFRLAEYERRNYPEKFRELKRLRKALAKLEGQAAVDRSLLGAQEILEAHRELRAALGHLDAAKAFVAQEFTDQLRGQWPCLHQTATMHWEVEFPEVFEERGGFDVVVGNPPWGADLGEIREYLEGGAYPLARGQYDSYELFIELARRLLHPGGAFGFIIPDSIVLPEHERLRRMLLDETTLTCLVRAGEGLFPSVYRAAFFVTFLNRPAPQGHAVRVGTLRKADRSKLDEESLIEPRSTVAEIVRDRGHDVLQGRFRENARYEMDILATGDDAAIVAAIETPRLEWPLLTTKGRGVEIGKSGEVVQCPYCYRWDNVPRKTRGQWRPKQCRHCGREFAVEKAAKRETIIAEQPRGKTRMPILPGESVNRYWLGPAQYIDTAKDGINYKNEDFYQGNRLLLRQTGVGIYATIDNSGLLTNQSVFTWKLREGLEPPLSRYRLEYLLGVLNSRLMLYRYYMKSGDTEWRSFPRWTQELIQHLPLRAVDFGDSRQAALHDEIADRVAAVLATGNPPSDHEDYQIEGLVMQIYGITRPMCRRIFEVLHDVQRLRVVREMNIAEPDMILDMLSE
jgi:hypothetical protein